MKDTITITSKGQYTLPASVRKMLGIGASGGTLRLVVDSVNKSVTLQKSPSLSEQMQPFWSAKQADTVLSDDQLRAAIRDSAHKRLGR